MDIAIFSIPSPLSLLKPSLKVVIEDSSLNSVKIKKELRKNLFCQIKRETFQRNSQCISARVPCERCYTRQFKLVNGLPMENNGMGLLTCKLKALFCLFILSFCSSLLVLLSSRKMCFICGWHVVCNYGQLHQIRQNRPSQ